MNETICSVKAT
jgi:hypothetical protein